MKRLNIAMLGEQAQDTHLNGNELATDGAALEIQRVSNDIYKIDVVIDETVDAADSMDYLAKKIQAQETTTRDTIAVAQEMIAYFSKRSGVKFHGVSTAMESCCTDSAAEKDRVVKELKLASEFFRGHVSVAQEGLFGRIKNKLSLIFSSYESLVKELEIVSSGYDKKGPVDKITGSTAFARVLCKVNQSTVTGKAAIELAEELGEAKLLGNLEKLTGLLKQFTVALEKKKSLEDNESYKTFSAVHDQIGKDLEKYQKSFNLNKGGEEPTVEPLTVEEKKKLQPLILEVLGSGYRGRGSDYNKVIYNFWAAYDDFFVKTKVALANDTIDDYDVEGIVKVGRWARATCGELVTAFGYWFDVAHACVKYIKASTA